MLPVDVGSHMDMNVRCMWQSRSEPPFWLGDGVPVPTLLIASVFIFYPVTAWGVGISTQS